MIPDFSLLCLNRDGKFAKIWLAATNPSRFKQLIKFSDLEHIDIQKTCKEIEETLSPESEVKFPLLVATKLTFGAVKIYCQQVNIFYDRVSNTLALQASYNARLRHEKLEEERRKRTLALENGGHGSKKRRKTVVVAKELFNADALDSFYAEQSQIQLQPEQDATAILENLARIEDITLREFDMGLVRAPEIDLDSMFGFGEMTEEEMMNMIGGGLTANGTIEFQMTGELPNVEAPRDDVNMLEMDMEVQSFNRGVENHSTPLKQSQCVPEVNAPTAFESLSTLEPLQAPEITEIEPSTLTDAIIQPPEIKQEPNVVPEPNSTKKSNRRRIRSKNSIQPPSEVKQERGGDVVSEAGPSQTPERYPLRKRKQFPLPMTGPIEVKQEPNIESEAGPSQTPDRYPLRKRKRFPLPMTGPIEVKQEPNIESEAVPSQTPERYPLRNRKRSVKVPLPITGPIEVKQEESTQCPSQIPITTPNHQNQSTKKRSRAKRRKLIMDNPKHLPMNVIKAQCQEYWDTMRCSIEPHASAINLARLNIPTKNVLFKLSLASRSIKSHSSIVEKLYQDRRYPVNHDDNATDLIRQILRGKRLIGENDVEETLEPPPKRQRKSRKVALAPTRISVPAQSLIQEPEPPVENLQVHVKEEPFEVEPPPIVEVAAEIPLIENQPEVAPLQDVPDTFAPQIEDMESVVTNQPTVITQNTQTTMDSILNKELRSEWSKVNVLKKLSNFWDDDEPKQVSMNTLCRSAVNRKCAAFAFSSILQLAAKQFIQPIRKADSLEIEDIRPGYRFSDEVKQNPDQCELLRGESSEDEENEEN